MEDELVRSGGVDAARENPVSTIEDRPLSDASLVDAAQE